MENSRHTQHFNSTMFIAPGQHIFKKKHHDCAVPSCCPKGNLGNWDESFGMIFIHFFRLKTAKYVEDMEGDGLCS